MTSSNSVFPVLREIRYTTHALYNHDNVKDDNKIITSAMISISRIACSVARSTGS